eukprot:1504648-Ditylum_brightwellii.AAC.1
MAFATSFPNTTTSVALLETATMYHPQVPATTYNMSSAYPHAIKHVPKETSVGYSKYKYGEYHLVWYDPNAASRNKFCIANLKNGADIHSEAVKSNVNTTQDYVQQMVLADETDDSIGGILLQLP